MLSSHNVFAVLVFMNELFICSGCNKECPIDKRPLTENDLFADSCIEREILHLKVKCPHASLGCNNQVELRYIEDHIHACIYQVRLFIIDVRSLILLA